MITSTFRTTIARAGITAVLAGAALGGTPGLPGTLAQAAARMATANQSPAHQRQHVASTRPPGREWASFAYDPVHHETVLFGGDNGSTVFGDTWTRQHGTWTQQHPARSPSPRTGAAMAYDDATSQLLLFGGSRLIGTSGGFHGDTWTWTGRTWRELHPATSPPARHNADMIYDAATQDVVLFGGFDGRYLGDTWTWNGTTWTQQTTVTAPAPRDTGSFVYDAATGTGVVFGGFNGITAFTDTWTWNGSTWTQLHPATAPGAIGAWMAAYDPITQQVLLFPQGTRQTWAWNGTTWTQLTPATSPPPRANGSMTGNTATRKIELFGGQSTRRLTTYFNTTWTWDGSTWHRTN
ncbi:MAG TPA: hypothetical protein VK162_13090 [Streptosporangiaceae bacterium]|nr:hypothetical protein [Streptosporangiaceae bacterium]